MKWVLEPVSGPEIEVVTLARMKREMGEFEDVTERDSDIEAKIVEARRWVERYTGRCLVDQVWRLSVMADTMRANDTSVWMPTVGSLSGDFQWQRVGEIMLRKSPILAISSFKSVDLAGVETTITEGTYEVREAASKWPRLVGLTGATWTAQPHLRITFRAGFADRDSSPVQDASVVPDEYKEAIILRVKWNYDGDDNALAAAKAILKPLRCGFGVA